MTFTTWNRPSLGRPARSYICFVQTLDAILGTCWKGRTIGTHGERESGNFLLSALRYDDDDDNIKYWYSLF